MKKEKAKTEILEIIKNLPDSDIVEFWNNIAYGYNDEIHTTPNGTYYSFNGFGEIEEIEKIFDGETGNFTHFINVNDIIECMLYYSDGYGNNEIQEILNTINE